MLEIAEGEHDARLDSFYELLERLLVVLLLGVLAFNSLDLPLGCELDGLGSESEEVSAGEVLGGFVDDLEEVESGVELEVPGLGLEDLEPAGVVLLDAEVEELVEAAGPEEGLVEEVGAVGGSDDEDSGLDLVQLGEELRHDAVHDLVGVAAVAPRRSLACW